MPLSRDADAVAVRRVNRSDGAHRSLPLPRRRSMLRGIDRRRPFGVTYGRPTAADSTALIIYHFSLFKKFNNIIIVHYLLLVLLITIVIRYYSSSFIDLCKSSSLGPAQSAPCHDHSDSTSSKYVRNTLHRFVSSTSRLKRNSINSRVGCYHVQALVMYSVWMLLRYCLFHNCLSGGCPTAEIHAIGWSVWIGYSGDRHGLEGSHTPTTGEQKLQGDGQLSESNHFLWAYPILTWFHCNHYSQFGRVIFDFQITKFMTVHFCCEHKTFS